MTVGSWEIAEIVIKSVMYGSTFGTAGGVFFLWHFHDQISGARRARLERLIGGLGVAGILASAVRIPVLAGSAGGAAADMIDGPLLGMMVQGADGQSTVIRLIGLALASTVAVSSFGWPFLALLGAVMAATSFVWVGHARGASHPAFTMPLIAIHLLGVSFWLGALLPLFSIIRDADSTESSAVLRRFGRIAGIAVGSLVVAGLVLLWVLIGTPARLWSSTYGRMFLIKLGLVMALLGLAALNKWRWTPRLLQRDAEGRAHLQGTIAAEVVIAILILLVTATFTTLTGPSAGDGVQ